MPLDSSTYFPQQKNDKKGPSKKCIGTHFFTSKDDLIPHKEQKKHKKKTNDTKILRDSKLPTFKLHDLACLWFGRSYCSKSTDLLLHLMKSLQKNTDSRWNKAIPLW